jgi:hypothetical protein
VASDISGTTGDKNGHFDTPCFRLLAGSETLFPFINAYLEGQATGYIANQG